MIQAAIFDMDGLLVDSEPLWYRAEVKIFADLGLTLTPEQFRLTSGVRIDEVVRIRHQEQPWHGKSLKDVELEIMREVERLAVSEGEAMPGVREVLAELTARGYPLAVASSSPLSMIEGVLKNLGIARYFSAACSAANEPYGKPHPAVYLHTAAKLGVPPYACMAFEDSIPGVVSARAANMTVIAVPDAHHYGRPEFGIAHLQLRSLRDFLDSDLLRKL